jgi:hypothetical protein
MSIVLSALQRQRRDTAANWTAQNPTLLAGEIGIESNTGYWKVGNGSTAWNSLAYIAGTQLSAYPIVDADIANNAITSAKILNGTIVNADISSTANIAVSKLASGTARQLLQTNAAGTGVEFASNIAIPGTLAVTGNVTFQGDLTVNGTETIINTQTLAVEDKNIELGKVASPTDTTADGGGITLKGTTDKTINWIDATDAWTFSEHVNLATGKEYRINGAQVLTGTALGSGVTGSSLTSVGTISSGTWQGTAVGTAYGGTGQTTYANGELLIGKTDGTLAKATLTAGTGVAVTNADGSITVAVDSTVVTTAQTGTVTSTMILDGTIVDADINASAGIVDTKLATIATAGKVSNSATTANSANTASAIVARDASGNFSAGTITADLAGNASTVTTNANLTGDVTSVGNATSIAAGVIVDADVNASAAIAGTKISPDFGNQNVVTTGTSTAASLIPTGSSVPTNGVYLPAANEVAIATNTTHRARIDSTGSVLIGPTSNRNVTNNTETPLLLVEGDNSNVRAIACIANPGAEAGFAGKIVLGKSRGTTRGSVTSLINNDIVGAVQFDGADGTNLVAGALIRAEVEGTPGTNDMPMRMVFATRALGGAGPTERMRITSAGGLSFNAGFGSVAPAFGCRAWVNFDAAGGTITVRASGGVSSVTRTSAGIHTVNLSTTMPDADFCVNVTSGPGFTGHGSAGATTTSIEIRTLAVATPHAAGDAGSNFVTIHR